MNTLRKGARLRPTERQLANLIAAYASRQDELELFRQQVANYFLLSKRFHTGKLPLVHSVKSRLKDPDHLREKIIRKWKDGPIAPTDLLNRITDCVGVRVLHLHSRQFRGIHAAITEQIDQQNWHLYEPPVAYSWDPEATSFFQSLNLRAETRDSYYTSIHYIVKPKPDADLTCEIQVRTLFEEAWGEIDHALNYPQATSILACKEQLRVLAKLASTGTRLADSIFATADPLDRI